MTVHKSMPEAKSVIMWIGPAYPRRSRMPYSASSQVGCGDDTPEKHQVPELTGINDLLER